MGDAIYCLSDQYLLARLYIYIYRYIYVCVYAYAHIFVVNLGVLLMWLFAHVSGLIRIHVQNEFYRMKSELFKEDEREALEKQGQGKSMKVT